MLDDTILGSGAQVNNGELTPQGHIPNLKGILDPAHYIGNFLFICTTSFTVIGIPVNMLIIVAILFLKRLRLPRNFIWIGIGVSNITVLVSHLMFVISGMHWEKDSSSSSVLTQAIYSWFGCISIFSLTFNITAAIFERHICVTYPKWHRRSVTINWIIALESCFFACILLISIMIANLEVFQPYLLTFFDVWNVKLLGTLVTMISPLVLSVFVGFLALVKKITDGHIPQQETVNMDNLGVNQKNLPAINRELNDRDNKKRIATDPNKDNNTKRRTGHFIHIGNNRISQLDLGAKQTFIYIAFIYLTFMVPTLISFISVFICLLVSPTSCSSSMGALYFIGVIMDCIHSSIVNPVAFVLFSKDFFGFFKSRRCRNGSAIKEKLQVDETSNHNKMGTIYEEPDEETEM